MTRRRITGTLAAAAAMAMLASSGVAGKAEPLQITGRRNYSDDAEMNFKPEYKERRKRGGNGKGRKWWNN